ncbi:histidine phosphatase family protein [bacterium]|nr:histidine phosphatase family protein [bacterium]
MNSIKKKIILLRHAESSFSSSSDFMRPLSDVGKIQAASVGGMIFSKNDWKPDLVIVSEALRTRETWSIISSKLALGNTPKLIITKTFYHRGWEEIVYQAGFIEEKYKNLLLIGHNPGWSNSVSILSKADIFLEPASAALLSYSKNTDWQNALLDRGNWGLEELLISSH